jgi:hypothetical protein
VQGRPVGCGCRVGDPGEVLVGRCRVGDPGEVLVGRCRVGDPGEVLVGRRRRRRRAGAG